MELAFGQYAAMAQAQWSCGPSSSIRLRRPGRDQLEVVGRVGTILHSSRQSNFRQGRSAAVIHKDSQISRSSASRHLAPGAAAILPANISVESVMAPGTV